MNAEWKKKAKGWGAALIAACSLGVQGVDFVKNDIQPVIEILRQNTATMKRIEQRLEDHERRLTALEVRSRKSER